MSKRRTIKSRVSEFIAKRFGLVIISKRRWVEKCNAANDGDNRKYKVKALATQSEKSTATLQYIRSLVGCKSRNRHQIAYAVKKLVELGATLPPATPEPASADAGDGARNTNEVSDGQ